MFPSRLYHLNFLPHLTPVSTADPTQAVGPLLTRAPSEVRGQATYMEELHRGPSVPGPLPPNLTTVTKGGGRERPSPQCQLYCTLFIPAVQWTQSSLCGTGRRCLTGFFRKRLGPLTQRAGPLERGVRGQGSDHPSVSPRTRCFL